jgi:hypothetical protein
LLYLSNNSTAYNSYFKWRKYYSYHKKPQGFNSICEMCIKLQLESYFGIEKSVVQDLGSYWSGKDVCLNSINSTILSRLVSI